MSTADVARLDTGKVAALAERLYNPRALNALLEATDKIYIILRIIFLDLCLYCHVVPRIPWEASQNKLFDGFEEAGEAGEREDRLRRVFGRTDKYSVVERLALAHYKHVRDAHGLCVF